MKIFHSLKMIFFLSELLFHFLCLSCEVCQYCLCCGHVRTCTCILRIQLHTQCRYAKNWCNLFGLQLDIHRFFFFSFVFCLNYFISLSGVLIFYCRIYSYRSCFKMSTYVLSSKDLIHAKINFFFHDALQNFVLYFLFKAKRFNFCFNAKKLT